MKSQVCDGYWVSYFSLLFLILRLDVLNLSPGNKLSYTCQLFFYLIPWLCSFNLQMRSLSLKFIVIIRGTLWFQFGRETTSIEKRFESFWFYKTKHLSSRTSILNYGLNNIAFDMIMTLEAEKHISEAEPTWDFNIKCFKQYINGMKNWMHVNEIEVKKLTKYHCFDSVNFFIF